MDRHGDVLLQYLNGLEREKMAHFTTVICLLNQKSACSFFQKYELFANRRHLIALSKINGKDLVLSTVEGSSFCRIMYKARVFYILKRTHK